MIEFKRKNYERPLLTFLLFLLFIPVSIEAKLKTKNVILITLDGIRWQEVFSGADSALIYNKTFTKDSANVVKKFWDDGHKQRRQMLMPFFWSDIANMVSCMAMSTKAVLWN